MTESIIELARRLGSAIASSPQASRLHQAQQELDKEPQLEQALNDYQRQAEKIAGMEQQQKPIEVADKHRLQELHDKLAASEVFKRYMSAQVDYLDLMSKVNEAMRGELAKGSQ